MSILTYLTRAEIRAAAAEIDGKTLTRPALLASDGSALTYCVDVDIGYEYPLRNVPLAAGNRELVYAEVGAAVRLRRSPSGRYEVVGFSKREPGTYTRIPVDVAAGTFGTPVAVGLSSRLLGYGELATFGGYGLVPYGAIAVFKGETLLEIRT